MTKTTDVFTSSGEQIPEGYMVDSRGALVPVGIIKEIDIERDSLVNDIVMRAMHLSEELAAFKRQAMDDVLAFVELSAEKYGVKKMGGVKGNISLNSYNGKYRVQRSINEYITFDERLEAAKIQLDECLKSWTSEASEEIRKIINYAFEVDKTGKISTQKIMGLLKVDIKDPLWKQAMKAIIDSITVSGSRSYIRIYKRVGETEKYEQINLDIAAL
ncbi:MAG: DUF3164 family protein [Chitinispirillia bacterium]|nr:DUF3164 family protein [Chitinispirillia bacterium]